MRREAVSPDHSSFLLSLRDALVPFEILGGLVRIEITDAGLERGYRAVCGRFERRRDPSIQPAREAVAVGGEPRHRGERRQAYAGKAEDPWARPERHASAERLLHRPEAEPGQSDGERDGCGPAN